MNNRSGNKRNNNQKKDLNNKSTDTDSVKNIKEFNKLSSVYIILNKYKILTLTIFFSALFLIFTTILSFWIYNSNLKQDEQLASLSNQLETMPQPISQGRLGLIIKKSNDKLMLEINEEIRTLNNKINEIENLINSYPKPISEGKIGLIFDKKIQKINKDLEKKINQKQSSENNLSSTSKQNQEMINEIKNKLNNIQVSLAKLSQVIGSGEIEKSLIQEIIDIKSEKGIRNFETNSLVSKEDGLIENTDVEEDLTSIIKQFTNFAYEAIKEDLKANKKPGLINSIIYNFRLIFIQRSLTPQEGNTVDSILSRAEYALNNKNYEKVFEELSTLPQEASAIMNEWRIIFEGYLENNS